MTKLPANFIRQIQAHSSGFPCFPSIFSGEKCFGYARQIRRRDAYPFIPYRQQGIAIGTFCRYHHFFIGFERIFDRIRQKLADDELHPFLIGRDDMFFPD